MSRAEERGREVARLPPRQCLHAALFDGVVVPALVDGRLIWREQRTDPRDERPCVASPEANERRIIVLVLARGGRGRAARERRACLPAAHHSVLEWRMRDGGALDHVLRRPPPWHCAEPSERAAFALLQRHRDVTRSHTVVPRIAAAAVALRRRHGES
eukprot:3823660-Prymnesium_polylepis.1